MTSGAANAPICSRTAATRLSRTALLRSSPCAGAAQTALSHTRTLAGPWQHASRDTGDGSVRVLLQQAAQAPSASLRTFRVLAGLGSHGLSCMAGALQQWGEHAYAVIATAPAPGSHTRRYPAP